MTRTNYYKITNNKMKKTLMTLVALATLALAGCTTQGSGSGLGSLLSALGSQNTANSLLDMVIGHIKIQQSELVGTWRYDAPGCAFTSANLLAKAGGAVAAAQIKEKLTGAYNTVGFNAANTTFTFTQDGQFSAKVKNIPVTGTYTYNPETGEVKLRTMFLTSSAFITRTTRGLALTFESKKLLTVLQAAAALSGNSTIQTAGNLSKQFDGARVGFEMVK